MLFDNDLLLLAMCEQMRHHLSQKGLPGTRRHDRKFEMAYFRHFILSVAYGVAICTLNIGAQGPGGTICSGSVKQFQNLVTNLYSKHAQRKYIHVSG